MPLFEKILYSTDFSPLAEYALDYVRKLKNAGTKEVIVVHVVDDVSIELPEGADLIKEKELFKILPDLDQEYVTTLLQKLETIKNKLEREGLSAKIYLKYGNVSKQIVNIAESEKVRLIIMGAHGKGLLTEILLGSVSTDVIRNAKCPVLIIKKEEG
ncbi:UspA domain-containing protein [Desulfurobacterium thermolithotrophum DSM 11699]|uniref:UspA domain-containing protein n=1 Tax=Desulfurobacterium thermolithotrophum (strain DSM 11699 / BSA) TaxID=868864 RepID=F0S191_DESTD|nr:universal stress protein [Desulfurobacterium thermolithotrophum]ADY72822.1 UspA domain-containing protein [Desulfurobacterium thermolithotrophum DSM 11699]